jgi:hypothetical protein
MKITEFYLQMELMQFLNENMRFTTACQFATTLKEAAVAWLSVPTGGLSELTPQQRRGFAQQVIVGVLPGEGKDSWTIEVRDYGIGLMPEQMPSTILSLNESNKVQKHYLAGAIFTGLAPGKAQAG